VTLDARQAGTWGRRWWTFLSVNEAKQQRAQARSALRYLSDEVDRCDMEVDDLDTGESIFWRSVIKKADQYLFYKASRQGGTKE
jgi:cell division protein FtsB